MALFRNFKFSILFILLNLLLTNLYSQNSEDSQNEAALEDRITILRRYLANESNWQVTEPSLTENVNGLLNFIENKPIDTILMRLNYYLQDTSFSFVTRLPEEVSDSLFVPGFYPHELVLKDIEKINSDLQAKYQNPGAAFPEDLFSGIEEKAGIIPPEKGLQLFSDSVYIFPDSLIIPEVIPDAFLEDADSYQRLLKLDSLRNEYVEQKRLAYNDSIVKAYRDSVDFQFRQNGFEQEYISQVKRLTDSVKLNNYNVLKAFNEAEIAAVNDTIYAALAVLTSYADYIDTSKIEIRNMVNDSFELMLSSQNSFFNRVWLKNAQNDSLSILVKNVDKRTIQMLIDDGVTISRFKPRETKKFDFSSLNSNTINFSGVGKKYELETPWLLGANSNLGFTQTYLNNWQKGGQSALSLLIILKGTANYSRSDGKVKWENSAEIRNGYIQPGGEESELQKNDDKFEFTSRFGVSAFKKWYYSAELNFETQFFEGYKYPRKTYPDPISAFLAPAKTFMKLGLDYKPNKDFSLLLSPVTVKNVFVRDTTLIDQTRFGVDEGKKSFWEPGLNADVTFKKELTKDIVYSTRYKMFINYKEPLDKYDINWENQLNIKLTSLINVQMMLHMIYDNDVLFPVTVNGVETEKPKLQLKQLVTVGFTYNISHKVLKTRRIG